MSKMNDEELQKLFDEADKLVKSLHTDVSLMIEKKKEKNKKRDQKLKDCKYKIIVKGLASTDFKDLKELDGISCQDNFAEYFDNGFSFTKDIPSGKMSFKYEDNNLYTYTIYSSLRDFTNEELTFLKNYTTGQWSDGIGEGFEQNPCHTDQNGKDVYVSPWFPKQIVTITQEKI